jgi:hypothetical protein
MQHSPHQRPPGAIQENPNVLPFPTGQGGNLPAAFAYTDPTGRAVAWVNPEQLHPRPVPVTTAPNPKNRTPMMIVAGLWGAFILLAIAFFAGGNSNTQQLQQQNAALEAQLQQIRGCIDGK